ncbi:methyltransferase family protein [Anaerobacterium chartisolvens]|uniref:Methyltransferase family protein n=1 Tax=Anaerobacterium chartisolvens TaxID=1297424 RepID=A0A369APU9_9FIRM|nr:class I SAM-dependent methyltransferase [Anaerobacterium chartisolvens]RCX11145.1 methyltransferase family protein [Anaerobacterium chartisolvens]
MDIAENNIRAWTKLAGEGDYCTVPYSKEIIQAARQGIWGVSATNNKNIPIEWFPESLKDKHILCLACGGGQQAPIFASLGADVTVLDNNPVQLSRDKYVADNEGLNIKLVEGDMRSLDMLDAESFDVVFLPVSTPYISEVKTLWKAISRVLKNDGVLIAGFINPYVYIFDEDKLEKNVFEVKNKIPYCSLDGLSKEKVKKYFKEEKLVTYSHTTEDIIGGQIKAGLVIDGFFEDYDSETVLSKFSPVYFVTRATKMKTAI